MKNNQLYNSWNPVKLDEPTKAKILGNILKEKNADSSPGVMKTSKKMIISCGLAICLIGFIILSISHSINTIDLTRSSGKVRAKYTKKNINISSSGDLSFLTEDEIFKQNTSIFKGSIMEINNILLEFNGEKDYRAIAKIEIDEVYRGNENVGDTVSILLPISIDMNLWSSGTGTVSAMRKGMTGIFMPMAYDEDSYYSTNGETIYLLDLAEYGFYDGERFAFLETNDGLVFSKWAYESIESAHSLEEIEEYIMNMLK